MERCRSGLTGRPGKSVRGKPCRGFESLSLRRLKLLDSWGPPRFARRQNGLAEKRAAKRRKWKGRQPKSAGMCRPKRGSFQLSAQSASARTNRATNSRSWLVSNPKSIPAGVRPDSFSRVQNLSFPHAKRRESAWARLSFLDKFLLEYRRRETRKPIFPCAPRPLWYWRKDFEPRFATLIFPRALMFQLPLTSNRYSDRKARLFEAVLVFCRRGRSPAHMVVNSGRAFWNSDSSDSDRRICQSPIALKSCHHIRHNGIILSVENRVWCGDCAAVLCPRRLSARLQTMREKESVRSFGRYPKFKTLIAWNYSLNFVKSGIWLKHIVLRRR